MSNFAKFGTPRKIVLQPEVMILRAGDLLVSDWSISARLAPFWYFFWNKSPGAKLLFPGRTVELSPDKIVLIPPLTLFSTSMAKPFMQLFIEFTAGGEFKEIQRRELVFPAAEYLPRLTADCIGSARLSMCLYSLLFDLLRQIPASHFLAMPGQAIDPRIAKTLDLISVRPKNECSNRQLSRALHMAPSSFSHLFKQHVGMSPQRYVRHRELEKAQLMLSDPELGIDLIAQKTGFANRYHFSKAFKAFFGINPAAMRKKTRAAHLAGHSGIRGTYPSATGESAAISPPFLENSKPSP